MDKTDEIKYYIKSSEETNSGVSFVVCSADDNSKEKTFNLTVDKTICTELLEILKPGTICISWNSKTDFDIFVIEGTRTRLSDLIVDIEMKHEIDPDSTQVCHIRKPKVV